MLLADNTGKLRGKFKIPPNVRAGAKTVSFVGKGGSQGSAVFVGQGQLTTQTLRQISTVTRNWHDPLAQTFVLENNSPIAGVDLWFTAKGSHKVMVQIRETSTGFPNATVLCSKSLMPSEIYADGVSPTRVLFDNPVQLLPMQEYALVVLTDDSKTALAIAELGKFDQVRKSWITAQPYQIGVLLSSSNASTWTAHQDKDMTFRLLIAEYNTEQKTLDLGNVDVADITDLMLLALADKPSVETRTVFVVVMPDGTEVEIAENQTMRLPKDLTGQLQVKAKLIGSKNASPTLLAGSQLLAAKTAKTADYITRAIAAGSDSKVKIIFDAYLPVDSSVTVSLAGANAEASWSGVALVNSKPLDNNFREYVYEANWEDETVRCKLTLAGTSANRPRVKNLRMLSV